MKTKKQKQQLKSPSKRHQTRSPASWDAMLAALRFALPYMEDHVNFSHNEHETRAAQLMREAIAMTDGKHPTARNTRNSEHPC
jgi:hypothetical protein